MVEGRFVLFDSREGPCRAIAPGQVPVDIDRLRHGSGGDPFAALEDERSARHQWRIAGLTIAEEIAQVDRRAVRRRIVGALRETIERAGGIWLCVAPFPFPYRSAVNFRIDYDQYDPHDFNATLRAIAGNEQATSHFVNAAAYVRRDDALARLRGLDVGSHGYRHHTYRTAEENLVNVRRGIRALQVFGIEPSGFVAPGGRFHRELLTALETLEVGHSSEFGLAYDELPLFPQGSRVLQIPVHPVCLGIFLEAVQGQGPRRDSATRQIVRSAIEYFSETARTKYRAGEPMFFYGHPTGRLGRYPEVLRTVFETAGGFGTVWKTTLSEFAAWWRTRAEIQLSVVRRGKKFTVTAGRLPTDYPMAIDYWRGPHVARMPLGRNMLRFSPSALAYENRMARPKVHPVRIDRAEGLRGRIRRWIDWERETPIEEIPTGNWRNWTKRTLRRLTK